MFERSESLLKILCAGIAVLLLWQLAHAFQRSNPLARASIPALPSLPAGTNSQAEAKNAPAAPSQPKGNLATNAARGGKAPKGTNTVAQGTNTVAQGTNTVAQGTNTVARGTNTVARGTNTVARGTNTIVRGTNATARSAAAAAHATNAIAQSANARTASDAATSLAKASVGKPGPNRGARAPAAPGAMAAGMPPGMPGMPGQQGPPLPPIVQARLDRIIDSELLAPVMRPQPTALLGILGSDAFVQAPNGQTGMIKEGEELGGIKLLKLGINRALVEEAGEQKELTVFSGFGSDSLLPKQTNSP